MKIAMLDLDGTLVNTVYPASLAVFGKWVPPTGYNLENYTALQQAWVFANWTDDEFMRQCPLIDGASNLVTTLQRNGWLVYALTARHESTMTKEFVKTHLPEIIETIFAAGSKADVVRQYDADLFVDDSAHHLLEVERTTDCPLVIAPVHMHNSYTYRDLLTLGGGSGRIMTRSLQDIAFLLDNAAESNK